jgi:hypothetical protein
MVTERVVVSFPDLAMTRERRLWQARALGGFERSIREPIVAAGVAAAACKKFASGRYANSDGRHVAYGQR